MRMIDGPPSNKFGEGEDHERGYNERGNDKKEEEDERRTPIQQVCGNLASFQLGLIAYYTSTPANTPGYLYLYW